jgi:hypothetical protein
VRVDPGGRGVAFAVHEARRQVVAKSQDREGCNDGLIGLASQFSSRSASQRGRMIARTIAETEEIAKKSLRSAR